MSDDQELIPIEQRTENGEQLTQSGLEEAEAASEQALVALQVSQVRNPSLVKGQTCSEE